MVTSGLLVDAGEQGPLQVQQVIAGGDGRVVVAGEHGRDVEGQADGEAGVAAAGGAGKRIDRPAGGGCGGHQAAPGPSACSVVSLLGPGVVSSAPGLSAPASAA